MSLALELDDRLKRLDSIVASQPDTNHNTEAALSELLLAVEETVTGELLASVLLLSPDGKRLLRGAAPSLRRPTARR
ncbi:MAG TPA: hypothetical protein VLM18_05535 [Croceibacterium sp.]|nr:hypothetical protein [Croceibacterium sp.]